ncbi:MAG: hypothetical protein RL112_1571 [Planctomycetota bacterium]
MVAISSPSSSAWSRCWSALGAALAVGWLCAGSCYISYCSEDCDPCVQSCKCRTQCNLVAPDAPDGLRIHAARVLVDERQGRFAWHGVFGLRAPRGAALADHARAVLRANGDLPGMPEQPAEWTLLADDPHASGAVLHFEADGRVATCLYGADAALQGLELAPTP